MPEAETIVISVGGSLIVPDAIDTIFLSNFKKLIEEETAVHGQRFVVIAGGGKTARVYQDAVRAVSSLNPNDLDWIGIHSTRLNGHLLRTIFRDIAYPEMITNPDNVEDVPKNEKLIVAAGYRPGASSDLRAIQIAKLLHAKKVINLSNIDYVYSSDPKQNPDAEKIDEISWSDFRKLIPKEWDPGLSSPFDPVASREADEAGIEVAIINGAHLKELQKYLRGEPFVGTRVHT